MTSEHINYVKDQIANGQAPAAIRAKLLDKGYSERNINDIFAAISTGDRTMVDADFAVGGVRYFLAMSVLGIFSLFLVLIGVIFYFLASSSMGLLFFVAGASLFWGGRKLYLHFATGTSGQTRTFRLITTTLITIGWLVIVTAVAIVYFIFRAIGDLISAF